MTESTQLTDRLRARLSELETEFETGQRMLAQYEAQTQALKETLLRVAGAITVLREELPAADAPPSGDGDGHALRPERAVVGKHGDGE